MQRATFWFDGGEKVGGWTRGRTWNGFGCPLFDASQIDAAVKALGDGLDARLDGDDVVVTLTDGEEYHYTIDGEYWDLEGFTWNEGPA